MKSRLGVKYQTLDDVTRSFNFKPNRKAGKHVNPDGLLDLEGPISRTLGASVFPPAYKTALTREGIAFKPDHVNRYIVGAMWATSTENAFMNVIEELGNNYELAADLWSKYNDRLKEFRSNIKNDVTSLEASARKSTEATNKMMAAYGHVIERLNSEDMLTAISNAERLAAAMTALANLQSHRLVLAVTDQEKP